MLGGALEARRGRGEHTAEGARRLSGKGWRRSSRLRRLERMDLDRVDGTAPGPSNRIYKYRFEPTDMPRVGSAVGLPREP